MATNGSDAWSGHLDAPNSSRTDGPLATLRQARQRIRETRGAIGWSGATVQVRGGRYELAEAFVLTPEDSGTSDAPIVYRAFDKERVILSGGKTINNFRPVMDPAVLSRIEAAARGSIREADLRSAGITDFGNVAIDGQRPDLLFRDMPMTLARWPNEGFAKIDQVIGGKPVSVRGVEGDAIGIFTYEGDRPGRWADEPEIWLHGYWFWDWADSYHKVQSVDISKHVIALVPPYDTYGYRNGQRFYALNLLAELDSPGEWYLDRERGLLYFWPPADIRAGDAILSVARTLISLNGASWISLQGFVFEATRGTTVQIEGGSHDRLAGCVIRDSGAWAVSINGGTNTGVVGCDISRSGDGGISLNGGDRNSLTPANHYAENNDIWDFGRFQRAYAPALKLSGVGLHVAHNRIHNGPHDAIQLSGNDHLIEWNEVYDVAQDTDDVGALYMDRDWTARGTLIQNNYFHDLVAFGRTNAMAVYLDDATSGIVVSSNVFFRAGQAVFIGGGRDNLVENNVFVECNPSVHVDARGLSWMRDLVLDGGTLSQLLREVPYQTPLWVARYPRLATLLDDQPGAPQGNIVRRNISVDGRWLDVEKAAEPFVRISDNLVDHDPKFVNRASLNFQLRNDSPAFALGFRPILNVSVGIYKDKWRNGLPIAKSER